jgi:RNA-binding protein
MLTSKQRSKLNGIAMNIQSTVMIGKNGLTDNVLKEIESILDNKEIVKITVLKNSDTDAEDIINEIAEAIKAEPVKAIGNKIILYRYSTKEDVIHIDLSDKK